MRKTLIVVAVALTLFAVGAFAAAFAVNSEDVASGADPVDKCADTVDIDFTTVYDGAQDDWTVSSAKLTFYDGASVTPDCDGYGATVAVGTAAADPAATGAGTVGTVVSGTATVTLSASLLASDITSAAVLADGKDLQVATPGNG